MVMGIIFRTDTTHAISGFKEEKTEFGKRIADPLWRFRLSQRWGLGSANARFTLNDALSLSLSCCAMRCRSHFDLTLALRPNPVMR
jgi:hypothetical protein